MKILISDTETAGLYTPSMPSKDPAQPHIVSVAAQLVDAHCNGLEELDLMVKPDGWTIPAEAIEIHGITNERAMDEGIGEDEVLHQLLCLQAKADLRAGYNQPFDSRIVRLGLYRHARGLLREYGYGTDTDTAIGAVEPLVDAMREEVADWWYYGVAQYDAMGPIGKLAAIPGRKRMKLAEAYEFCTGERMPGAHTAMGDVEGTRRVMQYLLDHDHVRLDREWIGYDLAFRDKKRQDKLEARRRY